MRITEPRSQSFPTTDSSQSTSEKVEHPVCTQCKEEEFEELATHTCSHCDGQLMLCYHHALRHLKKDPTHQLTPLNFNHLSMLSMSMSSSCSSFSSSPSVSSSPIPHLLGFHNIPYGNLLAAHQSNNLTQRFCSNHEMIPLNTYCRTCEQLICSQCALSKEHKVHVHDLIQEIEDEEREQLRKNVDALWESVDSWENKYGLGDNELDNEVQYIEREGKRVQTEIFELFGTLRRSLQRQEELLNEQVEDIVKKHTDFVKTLKSNKRDTRELLKEFDNLDEISAYEVIEKKLEKYRPAMMSVVKLRGEFRYQTLSQLHDMKLVDANSLMRIIQKEILELGMIIKCEAGNWQQIKPIPTTFEYVGTIGSCGAKNGQLNFPYNVKVSRQHSSLLVCDCGNKRIVVFDLRSREFKYNINTPSAPRFISIDHTDNDALIISCSDHCVYKYSLINQGKYPIWRSGTLNEHGNGIQQFKYPRGSVVDSQGNIFVCDHGNHRIQMIRSSDGQVIKSIESGADVTFHRPWGIDINGNGDLLISEKKSHRVQLVSRNGEVSVLSIGKKGSHESEFNKPRGILIDPVTHNFFVCDGTNHRIQIFSSSGDFMKSFGNGEGSKTSQFSQPHSMCFNEETGELFVADCGNHRIQIFK